MKDAKELKAKLDHSEVENKYLRRQLQAEKFARRELEKSYEELIKEHIELNDEFKKILIIIEELKKAEAERVAELEKIKAMEDDN